MLQVSELFIYPVKSLGGISLNTAEITDRGLKYDRRWMLIDENNRFLSQREFACMALMKVAIDQYGLLITYAPDQSTFKVPFEPQTAIEVQVIVWDDTCTGILVSDAADEWFSSRLKINCSLVYMPEDFHREVDPKYANQKEITSFADGYPFLLIGQSSLDELNTRVQQKLPMDRFRPNIVFSGGVPFQEDEMHHFKIREIDFFGVKPCARCVMITIDQQSAIKNPEPSKVLAKYRRQNNKIYFGQNLLHKGQGKISVGDPLYLI